ncbi:2-isopropylmalate synthase/homocitrate synthase family protein [Thermocrinis albus DSM 14484]|uniref:Citramalate synthase n=1 Tax=Thermocrinis albus (strain DSM 14484 / JCM 11386 / HI 11/12) TaxID=638303 RepID=D3SLJ2_THEAH|nr:citramalate synthase [Thermocrinis albus]ADC89622.1 2-isopropylmalate synthase/homocitrate synthase family protein [Thermocrinis albus DSM 14484]
MEKVFLYDTTLRDGSQAEGVSFSLEDKIRILQKLDEFHMDYVECGWPGANPKDTVLFERIKKMKLHHSKVVAFGATRRPNRKVKEDPQVENLVKAESPVVTIFGKSWDFHVTEALKTTLEENLSMVYETVEYLKRYVDEVIFDAEHFFDGFKHNPEYALAVLEAAIRGGADWVVLCDTNGGSLPHEVYEITKKVKEKFPQAKIGIHAHNDSDTAVANSLMAVLAGARQVHGTINGIGERTGNANLCSIIPNLQLKMGMQVVPEESLRKLTDLAHFVAEIANVPLPRNMPYVGESAFAHKAGVHASAVLKSSRTYEHVDPSVVGNRRKVTVSDLSGRSNVVYKLREMGIEVDERSPELIKLVEKIKDMEKEGYHFEAAEASFELLCKRHFGLVRNYFDLDAYRVLIAKRSTDNTPVSEATVRLKVGELMEHTASLGNGPVSALDRALRKALEEFYPSLKEVQLVDYKVRIVNESEGTSAKVRVLIESTDGKRRWGTVGVSENIIEASWIALTDSIVYKLMKDEEEGII